jgi:hypothetical protein
MSLEDDLFEIESGFWLSGATTAAGKEVFLKGGVLRTVVEAPLTHLSVAREPYSVGTSTGRRLDFPVTPPPRLRWMTRGRTRLGTSRQSVDASGGNDRFLPVAGRPSPETQLAGEGPHVGRKPTPSLAS